MLGPQLGMGLYMEFAKAKANLELDTVVEEVGRD